MNQSIAGVSLLWVAWVVGCAGSGQAPAAPAPVAGPTCDAGECNTRGMEAVTLARYAEAVVLLDRACTLGHAVGCSNLAGLMRGGAGGLSEPSRTVGLYDRACTLGFAEACAAVGSIYAEGKLVAPDPAKARHGTSPNVQVAKDLFDRACVGGEDDGCAAARQLAKGKGRHDLAIALTSSAPTLAIAGFRVHDLVCRMPEVGPMALAEAVEAVAAHKAGLDACAPQGMAPAVTWQWRGRRAAQVAVRGGGPKVEACVRKAVERARAELSGSCAAVFLIGDPEGARRKLTEQRSAGMAPIKLAQRGALGVAAVD